MCVVGCDGFYFEIPPPDAARCFTFNTLEREVSIKSSGDVLMCCRTFYSQFTVEEILLIVLIKVNNC